MSASRRAKDSAENQSRYIELDVSKSGRTVTVCLGGGGGSGEPYKASKSSPPSKPGMTRFEAASKAAQAWRSTSSSSAASRSSRSSRTTTSSVRKAFRFGRSPATTATPTNDTRSPPIPDAGKQSRDAPDSHDGTREPRRNVGLKGDALDDSRVDSSSETLAKPSQKASKSTEPKGGEHLGLRDRRRRARSTNRQAARDCEDGQNQNEPLKPAPIQQRRHLTGAGATQSVPQVPSNILQQPVYYINQPQPINDGCAPQFYYTQHPGYHFPGPMVSPSYHPVQSAYSLQVPLPTQAITLPPPTPLTPACGPANTGIAPASATSSGHGQSLQIQVPQVVVYTSGNSPATPAIPAATPSCPHGPHPSPMAMSRSNDELEGPPSCSAPRRTNPSSRPSKTSIESTSETSHGGGRMLGPLSRHYFCFGCGRVRSKRFHLQNPLRPDQNPGANYCANCRRQHAAEGGQQSQQRHAYPLQDYPDIVIPETSTIASGSCLDLDDGDDGFEHDDNGRYLSANSYNMRTPSTATPAALHDTPKRGRSLDCRSPPGQPSRATPGNPVYARFRQAQTDSPLKENNNPYAAPPTPSSRGHHGCQYRPPSVESVIDSSLGFAKTSAGPSSPSPRRRRHARRTSSIEPVLETASPASRRRHLRRSPGPPHQSGRAKTRDGGADGDTARHSPTGARGPPPARDYQGKAEEKRQQHHAAPHAQSSFDSTKQVRFDPHLEQWFSDQQLSSSSPYGGGDGEPGGREGSEKRTGETKPGRSSGRGSYESDDSTSTVLNAKAAATRGPRDRVGREPDPKDVHGYEVYSNNHVDRQDPFAIPPRPRKPQLFTVTTQSGSADDNETTASPAASPSSPYGAFAMPRPRCVSDWTIPTGWRYPTAASTKPPPPPSPPTPYVSPSIDPAEAGAANAKTAQKADGDGGGGGGGNKPTTTDDAQRPGPRAVPPPEILISAASSPDWHRRPHSTPAAPIDTSRLSAQPRTTTPTPAPRPASASAAARTAPASAPATTVSFDFSSLGDGPTPRDRSDPFYAHTLSDWELEQRLDELRAGPSWFRMGMGKGEEEDGGYAAYDYDCGYDGDYGGYCDYDDYDGYDEYNAYSNNVDDMGGGEGEPLSAGEEGATMWLEKKVLGGGGGRLSDDGLFDEGSDVGYQSSLD